MVIFRLKTCDEFPLSFYNTRKIKLGRKDIKMGSYLQAGPQNDVGLNWGSNGFDGNHNSIPTFNCNL